MTPGLYSRIHAGAHRRIPMLDTLTNRLSRVIKTLRGQARLTEDNVKDALREVRMALLEADVALPVVKDFIDAVKEKALGQEVRRQPHAGPGGGRHRARRADRLMGGATTDSNLAAHAAGGHPAWPACRARARPPPAASWRAAEAKSRRRRCCW